MDITEGLNYLHYDCIPKIIHRNMKYSNIILDEQMKAHIVDFGLAKFINPNKSQVTRLLL